MYITTEIKYNSKGLASWSWEAHGIIYLTRKCNLREFKQNRLRWVHSTEMMDKKTAINDKHYLIGQLIISFLPRFSVSQLSAVCISYKNHSRTIYYVFRPTSVWLVITKIFTQVSWFSRAWGQALTQCIQPH